MYQISVSEDCHFSKVQQIVDSIAKDIEDGRLKKAYRLPSINQFSEVNRVARDTVEKAYRKLRTQGYIISSPSRGYFVLGKSRKQLKVAIIFNEFYPVDKIFYTNLLNTLGGNAKVDLKMHRCNAQSLQETVEECLGNYNYYVIMPYLDAELDSKHYQNVLKLIPPPALIQLYKKLPPSPKQAGVAYQDDEENTFQVLHFLAAPLEKYTSITLIQSANAHLAGISAGTKAFCGTQRLQFFHTNWQEEAGLRRGSVYMVTEDNQLASLLKKVKAAGWALGSDIGILSFGDSVFKEFLDISTFSTDFAEMGQIAANLILSGKCKPCKISYKVMQRGSL